MADKKHNILIVTENLKVGGAEKYTVLVANELFRRGHKVVVLANDGPFRKHFDPGIRFVRVFFEHGILGVLYGAFQMVRVSLQERITFIHAQKLESSQAAWFARFITGVPVVKTAHGYTSKELITLGKLINKYSNKIVTVDDWLFGELGKNGIEADKLSVIYNGTIGLESSISAEEALKLRNDLGINQDDKVIVSTSRLVKGKNHPALLDWFKVINQQLPNTKLVLVGGGPEKDNLMKKTSELDLNNAVIFVDAITDTTKYLQISDIFCTPSVGRGMSVLEAMAAGLPVIGRQPISGPHVILDGKTGFITPKGDGETFIKRAVELLQNSELAKSMGAAGKERVENVFSCESMVDQLEQVYEQVI